MSVESEHYRRIAAQYDGLAAHGVYATLAPHNRGGSKSEYVATVFDTALLPLIENRGFTRLLDFGCGTGIFCRQAAGIVERVIGVDVSSGMLRLAGGVCAGLPNVDLLPIDGEHLPFEDSSFDCVVARETLCYVGDESFEKVLAELHRCLRSGGELLIIDQVSNDPYWQNYPGTPHQVRRSPASIRECTSSAGFDLLEEFVVRTPRFPVVYLAWAGLIPKSFVPNFASFEIAWHRRRPQPTRRWWDNLFRLVKTP